MDYKALYDGVMELANELKEAPYEKNQDYKRIGVLSACMDLQEFLALKISEETRTMELYNLPHNLERKAMMLRSCIWNLKDYSDIFQEDPMIQGYLERLNADYESVMNQLKELHNSKEKETYTLDEVEKIVLGEKTIAKDRSKYKNARLKGYCPKCGHKLERLYEMAVKMPPSEAMRLVAQAKSDEERRFYAYIMNMNLQRNQKIAIERNLF